MEPFFFSSSINSIPSQYPEDISPGVGDRRFSRLVCSSANSQRLFPFLIDVTVTLTFARPVDREEVDQDCFSTSIESLKLDTQAPLLLYSSKLRMIKVAS